MINTMLPKIKQCVMERGNSSMESSSLSLVESGEFFHLDIKGERGKGGEEEDGVFDTLLSKCRTRFF